MRGEYMQVAQIRKISGKFSQFRNFLNYFTIISFRTKLTTYPTEPDSEVTILLAVYL